MSGIFALILSIGMLIIGAYITYWILDNYGKITLFKVIAVLNFIVIILSNIKSMSISVVLLGLVSSLVSALISTVIANWVYNRTSTFWQFFGLMILVSIALVVVLVILGMIFGAAFIGGSATILTSMF